MVLPIEQLAAGLAARNVDLLVDERMRPGWCRWI